MLRKLTKNLSEISSTALDLATLRYPPFVYGGATEYGMIPVFCFHQVDPESLDAMLQFLCDNGYATLTADEYVSALAGRSAPPRKAVVLTFDDGWGSLWSVGFPLFRKHGTSVIVFIPPGRIERRTSRLPNLDDLAKGKCKPEDVLLRDESSHPLLAWEEITEMHASGLVDFQSHSFNHGLIHRSTNIVDFLHPGLVRGHGILELPCPPGRLPVGNIPPARWGSPLYETAPRLSDTPRVITDPRVAEGCVAFVEEYGGEEFFERPNWRQELQHLASVLIAKSETRNSESPADQAAAINFELRVSKDTIESMLPGKKVRHICYPWHVAGRIAVRESKEAGYTSAFWGKVEGRYYNMIPSDPLKIARVGGDFFYRLPGKGRTALFRILLGKAARRTRQGSPYLTH